MSLSIMDLSPDIIGYLARFLDPQDLCNFANTCKDFNEQVKTNPQIIEHCWKLTAKFRGIAAEDFNYPTDVTTYFGHLKPKLQTNEQPLPLNDYNPLLDGRMNISVRKDLQHPLQKLISQNKGDEFVVREEPIPKDIKTLLTKQTLTLKELKLLEEYQKARDTLLVWDKLAKKAHLPIPFNVKIKSSTSSIFLKSDAVINKSKEFSTWFNDPQNNPSLLIITSLDLKNLNLRIIPTEIGTLTALTYLDLSGNQLTALPKKIGKLAALTDLDLSNNKLTALPKEIGNLAALTDLDLSNNQLTALPKEIGNLAALKALRLLKNQLTALPKEIGNLAALTDLSLSNNKLTALPSELWTLTALTVLSLSYNQLTALPPEIGKLAALTDLDLSRNQLTALPSELWTLTALTVLSLSYNQLTTLPPEIGKLAALTHLDLSNNKLTALPHEIGTLTTLIVLFLSNNQLTALPKEIYQLSNNRTFIDTDNNPMSFFYITYIQIKWALFSKNDPSYFNIFARLFKG